MFSRLLKVSKINCRRSSIEDSGLQQHELEVILKAKGMLQIILRQKSNPFKINNVITQVWTKRATGPAGRQRVIFFFNFIFHDLFEPLDQLDFKGWFCILWLFCGAQPCYSCFPKVNFLSIFHINKYFVHQVDITAKLFEGNNVDREFLVYRTIIQVKHKVTVPESDLLLC